MLLLVGGFLFFVSAPSFADDAKKHGSTVKVVHVVVPQFHLGQREASLAAA